MTKFLWQSLPALHPRDRFWIPLTITSSSPASFPFASCHPPAYRGTRPARITATPRIFAMKRFFKLTGTPSPKPIPKPPMAPVHPGPLPTTTGLEPKYTVPPVLRPNPYNYLDVLVSSEGLLLRPHLPGHNHAEPYVRISWGLAGKVDLVEDSAAEGSGLDWSKAAVVYGVLGSLDLWTGM